MRSLSLKLVLAFLAVSLTGAALAALFAGLRTADEFGAFVYDQRRDEITSLLSDYYQERGGWEGVSEAFPLSAPRGPGRHRGPPDGLVGMGNFTLLDTEGEVLIAGPGFHLGDHLPPAAHTASAPVEVDGRLVGRLITERGSFLLDQAGEAFLGRVNRALLLGALGAAAGALLLGVIFARRVAQPLRELTLATQSVATGDLERQVPVRSRDELGQLAASFNSMSAQLARARDLRRQMTADIAHELRTPLSVIIGHAEAVHDGMLPASSETFEIIRQEADRLERLVEDLRTLSRAEAGELTLNLRPVSPASLLEAALKAYAPRASAAGVELDLQSAETLPTVSVDPDRMAQVLGNVLSNALRYTPEGGRVTLSAERAPGGVALSVKDSGPGLPEEERSRIFDRFYRTDKSRRREQGGSGLGLAIAKSIIESHGGSIRAESAPGEGLAVIMELPA